VARTERNDITDTIEAQERMLASPRKLPIEATDNADPTEPTERIEPTEPTERIDPFELIDSTELVELIDQREVSPEPAMMTSLPTRIQACHYLVMTALPVGSTTYQRPPALVSAWPVALPGDRSGGQKYRGHPL